MAILSSLVLLLLMGFVTARPKTGVFETTRRTQEINNTVESVNLQCGGNLTNIGEGLTLLTSPGYPHDFPAGVQCQWVVKSSNPFVPLRIKFADFDMGDVSLCNENYVEINERRKNKFMTLGKFCGQLSPLYIQSHNEVILTLKSSANNLLRPRRFMLGIEQIPCSHNYTLEQGKIARSGFGECFIKITAPENHTISLYLNRFVALSTDKSDVNFFKVSYGDFPGIAKDSPVNTWNFPGLISPHAFFSTGNVLTIQTRNAEGYTDISFDAYYTITDKGRGCGGKINNDNGTLTSPMYPRTYYEDKTCEWEITVTPGYQVSLEFEDFNVGSRSNCTGNYLELKTETKTIGRFCGTLLPHPIVTAGNKIKLTYVSKADNDATGWKLKYSAVKPH